VRVSGSQAVYPPGGRLIGEARLTIAEEWPESASFALQPSSPRCSLAPVRCRRLLCPRKQVGRLVPTASASATSRRRARCPSRPGTRSAPASFGFSSRCCRSASPWIAALAQIPRPADKKGLIRLYLVYESEQTAARKQVVAALKRGNLKRARQIDAHRSSQGPRASFAAFVLGAHLCQETVIG